MIEKSLISGLLICSILLVSTLSVSAADETGSFEDGVGDVVDNDMNNVSGKEYIDIKELVCSRDNRKVTLKLTVAEAGVIKNNGDINIYRLMIDEDYLNEYTSGMTEQEILELLESMLQDITSYSFELYTSNDVYIILYVNNEVLVLSSDFESIGSSHSAKDDTLTISFNLPSSDENLITIRVLAEETTDSGDSSYSDELYGEFADGGTDDENDNGDNDKNNKQPDSKDTGSVLITFIVLIVIIVVAGVAVVVYIIRR